MDQVQLFDAPLLDAALHEEWVSHDESMRVALVTPIENKDYFVQVSSLRDSCGTCLLLSCLICALGSRWEQFASENYLLVRHCFLDLVSMLKCDLRAGRLNHFLLELPLIKLVLH